MVGMAKVGESENARLRGPRFALSKFTAPRPVSRLANLALHRSPRDASRVVRRALGAAEAEGYVQTVLDTAPQLLGHVSANPDLYPHSDSRSTLVAAYLDARALARSHPRENAAVSLTDAELRVLAKLAEHLTYSQTASELYVSVNTVKTHVKNAYMKLGVTSRGEAISRATALELL